MDLGGRPHYTAVLHLAYYERVKQSDHEHPVPGGEGPEDVSLQAAMTFSMLSLNTAESAN